jgi:mRNA-degrading endonuclease toxin of MazEF toxin-antitoxin module
LFRQGERGNRTTTTDCVVVCDHTSGLFTETLVRRSGSVSADLAQPLQADIHETERRVR